MCIRDRKYEKEGHPYYASARLWDDGVINPLETRQVLATALKAVANAPIPDHNFPVFRMWFSSFLLMNPSKTTLYIVTMIAMVTWGLSWTNAKIVGMYGDAPLMTFWRFVFATLSFAPIVYFTKNSFSINGKSLRFIALNALFMTSYLSLIHISEPTRPY